MWVVHVAGPPICNGQMCTRCGTVLCDYSTHDVIRQVKVALWREGEHVAVMDGYPAIMIPVVNRPLRTDEKACK